MSTGPLLELEVDRNLPLGLQVEEQLRALVRSQQLPVGTRLPSTRALAGDLGVSRGVVVGAYAQLAAEGYITLRRGSKPTVASGSRERTDVQIETDVPIAGARFNLRPDLPDFALFPRPRWLAASRAALHRAANTDLAYGEPFGAALLRHELAPFLVRTRGVVATADRTSVCGGATQALFVLASVLREQGARRIAVEDPGHRWRTRAVVASGLEVMPVPVDENGIRVADLAEVSAVVVSPDHHFPSGVSLAPERRRALVEWAAAGDRLVIEHDHDGYFRYDRPPSGVLQALAPEHVAYVGSASALLVPTLRIGWAVLPARFVIPVANRLFATSIATSRLLQHALAEFIARGYLDRHLRRARTVYRRRREALVAACERHLPEATSGGAEVGLFVPLSLPESCDEGALLAAARARGFWLDGFNEHALRPQPPGLALGFAAAGSEPVLERALRELGAEARRLS